VVIYLSDKYADTLGTMASKRMLDAAGVKYAPLCTGLESLTLDFVPTEKK
jgi:dCMP deaminase